MSRQQTGKSITQHSVWFICVVALFITCLIAANITSVKLVTLFGVLLPAGIVIFPASYIFGDVLTEVYGYRQTRWVIWLGFLCNLFVVLVIYMGQILPSATFWDGQAAYERILGYTPRLLFASFLAYLIGEFANSIILARIKIATRGRWLWLRTTSSTVVGQGFDSLFFIVLAFFGTLPIDALLITVVTQWQVKSMYEVLATPLTYGVIAFLKKIDELDIYDYDTDFSPFALK